MDIPVIMGQVEAGVQVPHNSHTRKMLHTLVQTNTCTNIQYESWTRGTTCKLPKSAVYVVPPIPQANAQISSSPFEIGESRELE